MRDNCIEIWKYVLNCENYYQVSNLGRIRSMPRMIVDKNGKYKTLKGKLMSPAVKKAGYLTVMLRSKDRCGRFHVHSLVLETFKCPRPKGMECRHLDGNPKNNCVGNLQWDTKKNNEADKIIHGTNYHKGTFSFKTCGGINNVKVKLTENDVREIREFYATNLYSQSEIGKMYDVDQTQISMIVLRKNWKHVK